MLRTGYRWRWSERGFFLANAELHEQEEWLLIRDLLFAGHGASYYGTLVSLKTEQRQLGLLLTPWQAVTFFADESVYESVITIETEWDRSSLRDLSFFFLALLADGKFQPHAYERNEMRFAPVLDEVERQRWMQLCEPFGESLVSDWFSSLFVDLQKDPQIAPLWSALLSESANTKQTSPPQRNRSRSHDWISSESDWLTAIGWRTDDISVQFGLRLHEPDHSEQDWRLEWVVREWNDSGWTSVAEFRAEQQERLSAHLQQRFSERLVESAQFFRSIVPDMPEFVERELRFDDEQAWTFLTDWADCLSAEGVTVLLPEWWNVKKKRTPQLIGTMRGAEAERSLLGLDQMLAFDWKIAIEAGVELSEEQFMQLVQQQQRMIRIGSRWFVLTEAWVQQIREQLERHRKHGGLPLSEVLRNLMIARETPARKEQSGDMDDSGDDEIETQVSLQMNGPFAAKLEFLLQREKLPVQSAPNGFHGSLYEYQKLGACWLLHLRQLGFGACLADDMGLGKTIQLIAYLLLVRESTQEEASAPSLIVCPNSVLGNWHHELRLFAPALDIYIHHGVDRKRGDELQAEFARASVVLTTYSLISPDLPEFQRLRWDMVCLDEAQNIKNPSTKQSAAVRLLDARHRIAMTGTPIENNLNELWSIFDFINRDYLGSLASFKREFVTQIEKQKRVDIRLKLRALIYPFLLRREKKDPQVLSALPDKHEVKVHVQLTAEQTALYENVRRELAARVSTGEKLKMGAVLQAISRYKQICDHPQLFAAATPSDVPKGAAERSNKLLRLLEMIEEIHERGERVLVFTQYVEMGRIIVRELKRRLPARDVQFFDGSVNRKRRDQMIADFQAPDSNMPVLVLTIRSGGVGINLTAANHVFHYDRWWNPAVENQATDRVYRIGQTRDVTIYKLITSGTIEEKIDELLSGKTELADRMLQTDDEELMHVLTVKQWEGLVL